MSLSYKQIVYVFNRSLDWIWMEDEERGRQIKKEFHKIDWDSIPEVDEPVDYKDYYKRM